MFNFVPSNTVMALDVNSIKLGHEIVKPFYNLKTFEFLMAGKAYNHSETEGLCYVWTIFRMVQEVIGFDIAKQLIPLFHNNTNSRKCVRLTDGWCFSGESLANALCGSKVVFKKVKILDSIANLKKYCIDKKVHKNIFIIGKMSNHYVLIDRTGRIYDSIERDNNFKPVFYGFELYQYTFKHIPGRFLR